MTPPDAEIAGGAAAPAVARGDAARPGIWHALQDRLDLGAFVPVPTPGRRGAARRKLIRVGSLGLAQSGPSVLAPRRRRLRPLAAHGRHADGRPGRHRSLRRAGWLRRRTTGAARSTPPRGRLSWPVPPDLPALVADSLQSRSPVRSLAGLASRVVTVDLVRVPWADALLGTAYRRVGWLLYARPARLIWALVIVAGLDRLVGAGADSPSTTCSRRTARTPWASSRWPALDVVGVALYQIAQGLSVKRKRCTITGRRPPAVPAVPMIYVETSDVWMAGRRARMSVSLSGPFAMLVLGGALALSPIRWTAPRWAPSCSRPRSSG